MDESVREILGCRGQVELLGLGTHGLSSHGGVDRWLDLGQTSAAPGLDAGVGSHLGTPANAPGKALMRRLWGQVQWLGGEIHRKGGRLKGRWGWWRRQRRWQRKWRWWGWQCKQGTCMARPSVQLLWRGGASGRGPWGMNKHGNRHAVSHDCEDWDVVERPVSSRRWGRAQGRLRGACKWWQGHGSVPDLSNSGGRGARV